ncbi:hypothetical protein OBBRIDRAFT_160683 [Obba rivulosa]|uniref:Uncharacterized protein n=1 Tax=Obba rivulosa TaxID=1052685 RepID=A0A8E2ANA5_9APHY|nr:hypothetical protein OBBRIDRAFT_160683 [Obba rivulosa]
MKVSSPAIGSLGKRLLCLVCPSSIPTAPLPSSSTCRPSLCPRARCLVYPLRSFPAASANDIANDAREDRRAKDAAWVARLERDTTTRAARRERERAMSLGSDMEWVRAGGALRDARGRRDPARTAARLRAARSS